MVKPGGHRNIFWRDRKGELIPGGMGIPSDNIPLGLWRRLTTRHKPTVNNDNDKDKPVAKLEPAA